MTTDSGETQGSNQDERVAALRVAIREAFPAEVYNGKVTRYDGAFTAELDDEQKLYEALKGRKWTDVQEQLVYSEPDGYLLLIDEAFVAFVAAWFMRSVENIDGENQVRDFVV